MELAEYETMARLEDRYWWFVGRRDLVRRLLSDRVPRGASTLDIGCGPGAMSSELAAVGRVTSLDIELAALHHVRRRRLPCPVQASAESLPFPDAAFDAVTALDVIEHLDDDAAAAREIRRVLKPGGVAVLTVPAFPFLWSDHDVALHHRRRYIAPRLRKRLEEAGLRVERLSHAMTLLFPAVAAVRAIQRLRGTGHKPRNRSHATLPETPGPLNGLLVSLLTLENRMIRRMDLPFGVSIVCVARKPEAG